MGGAAPDRPRRWRSPHPGHSLSPSPYPKCPSTFLPPIAGSGPPATRHSIRHAPCRSGRGTVVEPDVGLAEVEVGEDEQLTPTGRRGETDPSHEAAEVGRL